MEEEEEEAERAARFDCLAFVSSRVYVVVIFR